MEGLSESVRESVMADLRQHFRPEFLNRVDEVVLFRPLGIEEVASIAAILIEGLNARLAPKRIRLELHAKVLQWLADRGLDPVYGARPLRRFIQREIETPLAKELLAGKIVDGSLVRVTLSGDTVAFEAKAGGFSG
jgi:ATP-dependent Clp protease ATP-binding subunit ClpB